MRLLLCILFTGIFVFEGFCMFLASIHGWPWLLPIGIVFTLVASLTVGFMLLGQSTRSTVKRAAGVGAAIAAWSVVLALMGAL